MFLSHSKIHEKKLSIGLIQEEVANYLLEQEGISQTYAAATLKKESYSKNNFKDLLQNGFHFKRSGDVLFRYPVAYFDAIVKKGTTHGAEFSYDTHVPLFFMGCGIKNGSTVDEVQITDIAPTLSMLLNIPFPNGCVGKPIKALFDSK